VAERLVFVELAAGDGPPDGEETLSDRRAWKPPAWFARIVAAMPRVWSLALLAVVVGGLLTADQVVRHDVPPTAPFPYPLRQPPTAGFVYADRGHCPVGITCTILGRPRQDLWDSYDTLFDKTQLDGGTVWFEPRTGTVYYQELDASGNGVTISLVEQRLLGTTSMSFGPTVDFMPDYRHGLPHPIRRSAIVTTRRGFWLVTATLIAGGDQALPIGPAIRWTAQAPLPGV
jgi:hypothetical protein